MTELNSAPRIDSLSTEELFSFLPADMDAAEENKEPSYSYWREVFRLFWQKKTTILFLILLAVVLIFSFVYPSLSGYDRYANLMVGNSLHLSPSQAMDKFGRNIHWILGTGAHGESVFDAVWSGARISLSLALLCSVVNILAGTLVGTIWGLNKRLDPYLLAVYYTVGNVPYILIVSVVLMLTGGGFRSMVFALTLTGWLSIAYQIRIQVMMIRDREYNLASIGLGTT